MNRTEQKFEAMGSGCGSVGRAVAYNGTRGLQFESRHRQNFIQNLYLMLTVEKTKNEKNRPGIAPVKKQD